MESAVREGPLEGDTALGLTEVPLLLVDWDDGAAVSEGPIRDEERKLPSGAGTTWKPPNTLAAFSSRAAQLAGRAAGGGAAPRGSARAAAAARTARAAGRQVLAGAAAVPGQAGAAALGRSAALIWVMQLARWPRSRVRTSVLTPSHVDREVVTRSCTR